MSTFKLENLPIVNGRRITGIYSRNYNAYSTEVILDDTSVEKADYFLLTTRDKDWSVGLRSDKQLPDVKISPKNMPKEFLKILKELNKSYLYVDHSQLEKHRKLFSSIENKKFKVEELPEDYNHEYGHSYIHWTNDTVWPSIKYGLDSSMGYYPYVENPINKNLIRLLDTCQNRILYLRKLNIDDFEKCKETSELCNICLFHDYTPHSDRWELTHHKQFKTSRRFLPKRNSGDFEKFTIRYKNKTFSMSSDISASHIINSEEILKEDKYRDAFFYVIQSTVYL